MTDSKKSRGAATPPLMFEAEAEAEPRRDPPGIDEADFLDGLDADESPQRLLPAEVVEYIQRHDQLVDMHRRLGDMLSMRITLNQCGGEQTIYEIDDCMPEFHALVLATKAEANRIRALLIGHMPTLAMFEVL